MAKSAYDDLAYVRALEYEYARKELPTFVRAAWPILEPKAELKWNWHHDYICEHLEATRLGQINRLIINVAPRTTKSVLASITFPDWIWATEPWTRFLFGSYAHDLAAKLSMYRRNILESDWYRQGFGHGFKLSPDSNTKSEFANDQRGQMRAAGIMGSITGDGGDYIIIDDPHDPKGALSDKDRETQVENFDLAWSGRLNDKKTGRIIVIMQRLHDRDLTGHLLEQGGYTHVKIPTICEERTTVVFPVTKHTFTREAGELLHAERDGQPEVDKEKQKLGPWGFSGQHQQDPVPRGGGLFTDTMFDELPPPDVFDYGFITADTSYNDNQENDFTVFSAWCVAKEELYLRDVWRQQIKASQVEEPAVLFINRFSSYGFRGAYIEPKGHGIYLNQKLPSRGVLIPRAEDLKEFFADRRIDKVARANNAVPWLANRKVHINPMIKDKELLLAEALRFPKAPKDDFVDTLIDAIKLAFGKLRTIFDVL